MLSIMSCHVMSGRVGTVSAPCRNLSEYGVLWRCRCRNVTSLKSSCRRALMSLFLSLPLIFVSLSLCLTISRLFSVCLCFCSFHWYLSLSPSVLPFDDFSVSVSVSVPSTDIRLSIPLFYVPFDYFSVFVSVSVPSTDIRFSLTLSYHLTNFQCLSLFLFLPLIFVSFPLSPSLSLPLIFSVLPFDNLSVSDSVSLFPSVPVSVPSTCIPLSSTGIRLSLPLTIGGSFSVCLCLSTTLPSLSFCRFCLLNDTSSPNDYHYDSRTISLKKIQTPSPKEE